MSEININSKFTDQSGDIIVVELDGHIDQSNSHQLQKMFDNILKSECSKVIVDFNRLFYMSSSGWGVFVGEIKRFRDRGGDIKLTNMNPEIYDVYQMLEFYHIFDDYNSIEDASASFRKAGDELDLVVDNHQGTENSATESEESGSDAEELTIVASSSKTDAQPDEKMEATEENVIEFTPQENIPETTEETKFVPLTSEQEIKLQSLPLGEKIKRIVAESPFISPRGIRKVLKHEKFGYTKVGFFQLRKLLRELDLNSKAKRYRYYRSC